MDFVVKASKHMRDLILGLLEYSRVSSPQELLFFVSPKILPG